MSLVRLLGTGRGWVRLGGVVSAVMLIAAWLSPGSLLADGGLLVGTGSRGPVMVGASAGGLDAYRTVATATGASNRLWLFVGDETTGTSVPIGVYDDEGGRLLGTCSIALPQSSPTWSSCSTARPVQTTAGHTYWLAIGHPSARVAWWAETGAVCQSRSLAFRSSALPDPFPMAQSSCADDGSNVALYLGDAPPAPEVRSSPTVVPTATPIVEVPGGISICYQVTVGGAPGNPLDVQVQTGACPTQASDADQQPARESTPPSTADETAAPSTPEADAADNGDSAEP
jgi:hypothetical protein